MTRDEIEAAIVDEERVLALVADLLERRCALESWPAEARDALALALSSDLESPEGWRALALQRHLFGGQLGGWSLERSAAPSSSDRRRAERLRSDLIGIVPFRAGTRLAR